MAWGPQSYRNNGREGTTEGLRMQQWNKGMRLKEGAMSEEGEDIWQDSQEDRRTGDWKANSRVFSWAMEGEWVSWRGWPLWNERRDVQSTALRKDDDGSPGPALTLSGNRSGWAALGREQWEQLESYHHEKWAKGKLDEANHRCHKHSPRKRRNGCTPVGYSGWIALRKEHYGM
jgi:hypothetical protein